MREIRKSGSTSGDVETAHGRRSKAPTSRKGRQPYDDYLNHRATPRLYWDERKNNKVTYAQCHHQDLTS